jgi:hypothetical protein
LTDLANTRPMLTDVINFRFQKRIVECWYTFYMILKMDVDDIRRHPPGVGDTCQLADRTDKLANMLARASPNFEHKKKF